MSITKTIDGYWFTGEHMLYRLFYDPQTRLVCMLEFSGKVLRGGEFKIKHTDGRVSFDSVSHFYKERCNARIAARQINEQLDRLRNCPVPDALEAAMAIVLSESGHNEAAIAYSCGKIWVD